MIKLLDAKFKCMKLLGLYLVSFGCSISLYSRLIGCVIEGGNMRQQELIELSL